jgi:ubiquinone/menaquinone biosynthesis C-methylase UbiE
MLYELSIIDQNPWIKNALDIGAATGRHPMLLADRGINSFGVDIETQAMQYAKRMRDKLKPFATYPLFCVGDSLALPIRAASFDYVSCMMGTFAHIPIDQKKNMLLEVYRVLNKSGIFVMSTWDIECNHVSYLSIYNEEEKNCIRMNSLPLYDTLVLYEQCNFHVDNVFSFMMVPNVFTYDLRLESLNITDLKLLAEVDLAVRTQYPKNHGEMFMVVAIK